MSLVCPECKVRNKIEIIDWTSKLCKCTACGVTDYQVNFQVVKQDNKPKVKPYRI